MLLLCPKGGILDDSLVLIVLVFIVSYSYSSTGQGASVAAAKVPNCQHLQSIGMVPPLDGLEKTRIN